MSDRHLSASQVGAVHELEAAVWLMEQGYEVFRNLSPVGPIDLVAIDRLGAVRLFDVKSSWPSLATRQVGLGVEPLFPDGSGGWRSDTTRPMKAVTE